MDNPEIIELMHLVLAREQNIDIQVQFWLTENMGAHLVLEHPLGIITGRTRKAIV